MVNQNIYDTRNNNKNNHKQQHQPPFVGGNSFAFSRIKAIEVNTVFFGVINMFDIEKIGTVINMIIRLVMEQLFVPFLSIHRQS